MTSDLRSFDSVVVVGLGLIGLISGQLHVWAMDYWALLVAQFPGLSRFDAFNSNEIVKEMAVDVLPVVRMTPSDAATGRMSFDSACIRTSSPGPTS